MIDGVLMRFTTSCQEVSNACLKLNLEIVNDTHVDRGALVALRQSPYPLINHLKCRRPDSQSQNIPIS
jgi:hypothetical protein